ncbi:hypothetical protein EKG83_32385 [Saccharothrix syringae]|uniref:Uncharacterized protein n=1 Tax=Saccharothrix syringae TaxID=103733 RepID=A0A5Q0H655_SACSY|nr:hypothetical protein EKG83_32385 [Saccharothrix syringae]
MGADVTVRCSPWAPSLGTGAGGDERITGGGGRRGGNPGAGPEGARRPESRWCGGARGCGGRESRWCGGARGCGGRESPWRGITRGRVGPGTRRSCGSCAGRRAARRPRDRPGPGAAGS